MAIEATAQQHPASSYDSMLGMPASVLQGEDRIIARQGIGSRFEAVDGRWYIDYNCGAGANILGHCHPEVVEALSRQAARGVHFFGILNDVAIEYGEKLKARIPCAEKLIFSTTGSEATFYALRMARAFTGRSKILKFEGAYHGNHDYSNFSLFPTAPANYPVGPADSGGVPDVLQPLVLIAPYNDAVAVEEIVLQHKDDLAAIIVEGVQRIIVAKPDFLAALRRLCDEHGIVLILDEVVSGFRLALGGAQEFFGIKPDLATYGKVVSGGGPLACIAGRADIMETVNHKRKGRPDYAYINGTLHGNPMAAAAGLATINVLERPGFYDDLFAKSTRLKTMLQEVLDHNGLPAIVAGDRSYWQFLFIDKEPSNQIDILRSDVARMRALDLELQRRGIYVHPGVRRFVSAVHTDRDFQETVDALDQACRVVKRL